MTGFSHKKERRQFVRLRSYCLLRYALVTEKDPSEVKISNVKNISECGLLFAAYEPMPLSSTVRLTINLPGVDRPIETFAKVLRCAKVKERDNVYHVGVAFLDIRETDRMAIAAHVEEMGRDEEGRRLLSRRRWWQFWRRKRMRTIPGTKDAFLSPD